ncbi:acetylornithine transaminase [Bacillus niameyensis]|uniref:acetylornithine transaminase n=1 Tax=Bacillus niameyensis TaxID=1522308 RepID=UPI000785CFA1|nr:acetylornithine transaminase [Bacillus niameyensis]
MSFLFENYGRWDLELTSGNGTIVIDSEGKEYLDFTAGIGVCNLGHCYPKIVDALIEQTKTLWHTSNLFKSSLQEEVAERLTANSVGDVVFFCNSGAEANEAAIKLARKHTGKSKIITFKQSFHGRTFATMAATGQDKVKQGFGNMLETFIHVPYNDIQALEEAIDFDTAAIMLEVIQGEGGVHPAREDFLNKIEKLCCEYGTLLIVDEVQTGIGRTGKPFGYQHYSISPDIITSAKGLGNGFPVGAIIAKEELKSTFNPGSHGSTFGGNPLAMAAAKETLDTIFNDKFLLEVQRKGEFLAGKLQQLFSEMPNFKGIRYKGLMFGLEFEDEVAPMLAELRKSGLIVLNAGPNVIRLLPPLTVTNEELEKSIEIMKSTLFHKVS